MSITTPTTGRSVGAAGVIGRGAATLPGIKTDSYIFGHVIATLKAGLAARSITGVTPQQWYQPRVVGAPAGMAMLLSTVATHEYGFLGRDDNWTDDAMVHTEKQVNEIALQLTGWSPVQPSPAKLPALSAADIAKMGARILQSDAGREQLRAAGLGIERITAVRQPYGKDETDQFIGSSSFDFVLALEQVEKTTVPIVTATAFQVKAV